MKVELISITPDAEALIARAYGICTGRETIPIANIKKYVDIHPSPVEHASATFEISGISRACSHQLVRHRLASYSQESQRYVEMSEPEFVIPATIAANDEAMRMYNSFLYSTVKWIYNRLCSLDIPKEDARFILPNATATRIITTQNFRQLRHFFKVRCDPAAQWEIRAMALEMLRIMYQQAPAVFQDLHEQHIQKPGGPK